MRIFPAKNAIPCRIDPLEIHQHPQQSPGLFFEARAVKASRPIAREKGLLKP
jgi:hypothetical protein